MPSGVPVVSPLYLRVKQILHELGSTDDDQITTNASYQGAVDAALFECSSVAPLQTTDTQELTGGSYEFDLPSDWSSGFSKMLSIEYPSGSQDPEMLDADEYLVTATKWRLLKSQQASTGEYAILTYTVPYTEETLTDAAREPVALLAASSIALELAAKFGRTDKPAVPIDVVDYRSKADEWRAIARDLRLRAFNVLGIPLDARGNVKAGPSDADAKWDWNW